MTGNSKPPISAFIRTKNESRLVADVVRAAFSVADEVVVVDSGSTDATIALAQNEGARVISKEWLGSGRQKRFAEDQCKYDWLLDLDADEIVTPELADEIAALFLNGEPPCNVYRTPIAIAPPFGAPWRGFGGVIRHKLYDRRIMRAPDHAAWDQFDPPPRSKVGTLKSSILHFAYSDTSHLLRKVDTNSSVRAERLDPKPRSLLVLRIFFGLPFYVGKRYFLNGLFRAGVSGFSFSMISGFGRWLRDVKMYERIMREREK